MTIKESIRIAEFNSGQLPDQGYLLFSVIIDDPVERLEKVKFITKEISEFNSENWPSDEIWDSILPMWFVNVIKKNTFQKIINSKNFFWDYGSWLDAMKHRGWEWYSSKITSNGFEIVLEPVSFPFSINPLEYLIFEATEHIGKISFTDCSTKN